MTLTAHLRDKLAALDEFGGHAFKPGATVQQASEIHDQFIEARAALSLAVEELERIDRLMAVVLPNHFKQDTSNPKDTKDGAQAETQGG